MSAKRNIRMVKLLLHAYLTYYQDISATASILPPVPDTAASFNATEVAATAPNLEATALGSCSCSSKFCNFSPDSCSILYSQKSCSFSPILAAPAPILAATGQHA